VPLWIGIAVTIAALASAVWLTRWYPDRVRAKFAAATPNASRGA
jgi:hypothetical protein